MQLDICTKFLSTLSLRRATTIHIHTCQYFFISIHALLAESDAIRKCQIIPIIHFYPRSPCGERPQKKKINPANKPFLSTLSLRRATREPTALRTPHHISIHALLAESDNNFPSSATVTINISIHALLAESDINRAVNIIESCYFYPRSPCGERLPLSSRIARRHSISIHALLAESDSSIEEVSKYVVISIHALLAESDQQY